MDLFVGTGWPTLTFLHGHIHRKLNVEVCEPLLYLFIYFAESERLLYIYTCLCAEIVRPAQQLWILDEYVK